MRLADLFEDTLSLQEFEVVITVEVPDALWSSISGVLYEGWRPSSQPRVWVRVDPERPEIKQQRHVHVALKKHTGSKDMQASWNEDRSRHDKATFNAALGSRESFKAAARDALGLDQDAVLEWISYADDLTVLSESILYNQPSHVVLRLKSL